MKEIQAMAAAIKRIADPNDTYSQDDFDKEFVSSSTYSNRGETINSVYREVNGKAVGQQATFTPVKIKIPFTNTSSNEDPTYATEGSAGFDLRASVSTFIPAGKWMLIPTGLSFQLPPKLEIQVRPRSGLAVKHGVTVLNTPGTIDSDYRGEVKVCLINHSTEDFFIAVGDRIAQAVVGPSWGSAVIVLNLVESIDTDTERGSGGFGSTGIK